MPDVQVEVTQSVVQVEVTQSPAVVVTVSTPAESIAWTQLRLADALGSQDPSGIVNSSSEDADGWQVEIEGAAVASIPNAAWWRFAMPEAWRGDGTQALVFRVQEVTATDGGWWAMPGVMDEDGLAAGGPIASGGGLQYLSGAPRALASNASLNQAVGLGAGAVDAVYVTVLPSGPDDAAQDGWSTAAWGKAGDAVWRGRCLVQSGSAPGGTRRMVLGFGTSQSSAGTPRAGKVRIDYAVVDLFPSGTVL